MDAKMTMFDAVKSIVRSLLFDEVHDSRLCAFAVHGARQRVSAVQVDVQAVIFGYARASKPYL